MKKRKLTERQKAKREADRERRVEERMLDAAGAFLKMRGWNPMVIGTRGVGPGWKTGHHFELILSFTGTKPKHLDGERDQESGPTSDPKREIVQ